MLKRVEQSELSSPALGAELCAALNGSRIGAFVVDFELELTASNPTGRAVLEGQFAAGLPEELVEAIRRVLADGAPLRLELARERGSWDVECLPLGPPGTSVAVLLQDAQERQALRRELERASRTEMLGKLAGSIAHDFNNLLTGIRGSLAMASQNRSKESHDGALQAADLAAQRAGEMTRQLLAYSRGPSYVAPRADARGVLTEAAQLLSCLPDGARVEVELEADLGRVDTSPAELHQIVLNLLMNARDAVKPLGARGRVMLGAGRAMGRPESDGRSVPVSSKRPRRWLRVTVRDNGSGMDAATLRKIFEPFFTTKPGHEGTGLGLSSVRDIVQRAGGWIDVQSKPAEGATFEVYLPLMSEGPDMNLEGAAQTKVKQVLICDDEARLASLTAGLLREFGYDTLAVGAGEEALALLRSRADAVGVLLLDVNLAAGVSAQEILRTMKDEGLASPVILTSGFAAEDIPDSLRRHDCVASYLPKPYTVAELVAAIRRALHEQPRDE